MSVVHGKGIHYGTLTKAAIVTEKTFTSVKDAPDFSNAEWSLWGDNNDEPNKIADDIENNGVLSAACDSEARLAIGKGPEPVMLIDKDSDGNEILEPVFDAEILDFMESNKTGTYAYGTTYNKIAYGWAATDIILNKGRDKINRIKTLDVFQARLEKKDKNGFIGNLYLCADWSNAPAKFDGDIIKKIQLLREGYELDDLTGIKSGYEFGVLHRTLRNGRGYYPTPLHRAAKAWVEISRSIPNIKKSINANMVYVKYMIMIAEPYWTRNYENWADYPEEERKKLMDATIEEINEFLAGELNAGKTITAGRYYDPVSKQFVDDITITPVADNMKDGKMLPDSAAADKQILFSMMFNPAIWGGNLLGDGASGGAGSGSDIREATLVLLNLLNIERIEAIHTFNIIKKFNGWSAKLEKERIISVATGTRTFTPRLVFRYPSTILTTLDKGGSTKQTTN